MYLYTQILRKNKSIRVGNGAEPRGHVRVLDVAETTVTVVVVTPGGEPTRA